MLKQTKKGPVYFILAVAGKMQLVTINFVVVK